MHLGSPMVGMMSTGNLGFVAMGYSTTVGAFSFDGITWQQTTMPFGTWVDSAWNGYIWVAINANGSNNTYAYSYDGIIWQQGTLPVSGQWQGIVWMGNKFVIVGNSTYALFSVDGINWNTTSIPSIITGYRAIVYDGTVAVAFSAGSIESTAYSYNGITWVSGNPTVTAGLIQKAAWNGTNLVAVDINDANYIDISSGGIPSWSVINFGGNGGVGLADIIWNQTVFIILSEVGTTVFTSADGNSWTRISPAYNVGTGDGNSMAWNGKVICAISSTNKVVISINNGTTWTQNNLPVTQSWRCIKASYLNFITY